MSGLSSVERDRLRGMAAQVREIADLLDQWQRRDAPDAQSRENAQADASDLFSAAAYLRRVGERE